MPEEKYGIENIKELIGYGIDVGQVVKKAKEDGKVDWKDGILFVPVGLKIPVIVRNATKALAEYRDMSDEEREEIKLFVQDKVECDKPEVERLIEDAGALVVDISLVVDDVFAIVDDIKAIDALKK